MSDFDLTDWLSEEPKQTAVETKSVLSAQAISVLNYCEQVYWESGLLPTVESCVAELSVSPNTCRRYFQDETFRTQLSARGMDTEGLIFPGKLIKESRALSPKQIICANMMLNLHDKRSEREKLAEIQVGSQQYHAWLRNPTFIEFMRKRGEALFQSSDFAAYKSLVNNVKAGDNKSLELFFRMRGIYNPSVNININIDVVLQQVVEIIARHVKDPIAIEAIASELESIIDAEEVA